MPKSRHRKKHKSKVKSFKQKQKAQELNRMKEWAEKMKEQHKQGDFGDGVVFKDKEGEESPFKKDK